MLTTMEDELSRHPSFQKIFVCYSLTSCGNMAKKYVVALILVVTGLLIVAAAVLALYFTVFKTRGDNNDDKGEVHLRNICCSE